MKIEEQKKLNELREKMLLEQAESQAKNERDRKENLNKYETIQGNLQSKCESQANELERLHNEKRDMEG